MYYPGLRNFAYYPHADIQEKTSLEGPCQEQYDLAELRLRVILSRQKQSMCNVYTSSMHGPQMEESAKPRLITCSMERRDMETRPGTTCVTFLDMNPDGNLTSRILGI